MTPFENVTRAALEEILKERLHESRRGYILTKDSFDDLVGDLFKFLKASRSLKEVGDRFIASGGAPKSGASVR